MRYHGDSLSVTCVTFTAEWRGGGHLDKQTVFPTPRWQQYNAAGRNNGEFIACVNHVEIYCSYILYIYLVPINILHRLYNYIKVERL